jgi:hypothetical protein
VPEEVGDQTELFGGELGDRARGGMGAENFWPTPSCSGEPTTNCGLGGIEGGCDVALLPAQGLRATFPCVFEDLSLELSSHYIIDINCNALYSPIN